MGIFVSDSKQNPGFSSCCSHSYKPLGQSGIPQRLQTDHPSDYQDIYDKKHFPNFCYNTTVYWGKWVPGMVKPVTQRYLLFFTLHDHFEAQFFKVSTLHHITEADNMLGHASQILHHHWSVLSLSLLLLSSSSSETSSSSSQSGSPPPSLLSSSTNLSHEHILLKINSSTGKKKKLILTESNETYTECSRLQINDMCQTILEESVYWLSNEHRKTGKPR